MRNKERAPGDVRKVVGRTRARSGVMPYAGCVERAIALDRALMARKKED